MKVTKKNSFISCYNGFLSLGEEPYAHITWIGVRMRAEEQQNITVLDIPKFVRENGKDYLVKEIDYRDLRSIFPKLKKVRIPKGVAHRDFLDMLTKYSIEVEEY